MNFNKDYVIKKIINYLLNVLVFLFGIVLLISIYISLQIKILGNEHASFFGYTIFEVQSGSMAKAINKGDWVIVKLTNQVDRNDIITYKLNNDYITHRVVEVYKGGFVTKGDFNKDKDEPILQKQVVGKVVKKIGGLGFFRKTIFNPAVLITLIITLFFFNLAFKKESSEKGIEGFFKTIFFRIKEFLKKIQEKIKGQDFDFDKLEEGSNILKVEKEPEEKKIENKIKVVKTDERDLSKTTLFRVIPVDASDVNEKYKDLITKEVLDEPYKDEDDLDKTSLYRMIEVNPNEVSETFLEIAENELKDPEVRIEKEEKEPTKKITIEEQEESLTDIDLELLKGSGEYKKGKNIIDTALNIKRKEIEEIINLLIESEEDFIIRSTIKEEFLDVYINAKYRNYYDHKIRYQGKKFLPKIEKTIKDKGKELIKNYKGNFIKQEEVVNKYLKLFILIMNLEQGRDFIYKIKVRQEFYKKLLQDYFSLEEDYFILDLIKRILKIVNTNQALLKIYLEELETSTFKLNFNQLTSRKNMRIVELDHNISFSKVYSDYIIDKTYSEGIVAEDKIYVLISLLSLELIKNMLEADFNKDYLFYLPPSLYSKTRKFQKLLRMLEDLYAKDHLVFLITFEELLKNKKIIKGVKKSGYKFGVLFIEGVIIKDKDRPYLSLADYILIDKKDILRKEALALIPKDLRDKVIYEDIITKMESLEVKSK